MYAGNKKYQNPPIMPKANRSANAMGLVFIFELSSTFGGAFGDGPAVFLTPVTEHPMMSPCLRTPRYHSGCKQIKQRKCTNTHSVDTTRS
jgi:hypothetical protein